VVALAAAGMTAGAGVDYALGRGAAYRKCPHLVAPAWRLHSGGVLERAPQFSIGQLARRTGIPVRTIRFWSDAGVLPPSGRTESGYRLYDAEDVARLELVRTLRDLGGDRVATDVRWCTVGNERVWPVCEAIADSQSRLSEIACFLCRRLSPVRRSCTT